MHLKGPKRILVFHRQYEKTKNRNEKKGESKSCSDGGAMLSKSLIQFSVDGLGCVPSLMFDLRSRTWWASVLGRPRRALLGYSKNTWHETYPV